MSWKGWYHVIGNTYGTWLRGDHRGWRERHHRKHVEGDYKHPPAPGTFEELEDRSRELMIRPPVYLDHEQRKIAGQALIDKLVEKNVLVVAVSVDSTHFHVLAKFEEGDPRMKMGLAKKNASIILKSHGIPDGTWAIRSKAGPVRTREHQLRVYDYILNHSRKTDAWTWRLKDGVYWTRHTF